MMNLKQYEESKKHELEWLVQSTSQILGSIEPLTPFALQKIYAVMNAWMCRCGDDDVTSSTSIMSSTSFSSPSSLSAGMVGEGASAHVVERLLQRVIDEGEAGNVHVHRKPPNTNLYNLLIEAWTRSSSTSSSSRNSSNDNKDDDRNEDELIHGKASTTTTTTPSSPTSQEKFASPAERAQEIIDKMEEMANVQKREEIRPNTNSYYLVMKAWVRTRDEGALKKMEDLLHRMEGHQQREIHWEGSSSSSSSSKQQALIMEQRDHSHVGVDHGHITDGSSGHDDNGVLVGGDDKVPPVPCLFLKH
jgi:hypothetical protein